MYLKLLTDSGLPRHFLDKKILNPMYVAESEILGTSRWLITCSDEDS